MLKNLLFGGPGGGSRLADLGLLVLRLFAGITLAVMHGWPKLQNPAGIIGVTAKLGFPAPTVFGWLAIVAELAGGVLLALGLATRPAAFLIGCTMSVAAFLRHRNDAFVTKELALLYLAVAVCLLFTGAGRYGADVLLRRKGGGSSRGKRVSAKDRD